MQVELLDSRWWKTRVEPASASFDYTEVFKSHTSAAQTRA
jgi:hypothetical protein